MFDVSQLPGAVQTGFARELSSPAPEVTSPAKDWQIIEYGAFALSRSGALKLRCGLRVLRHKRNGC